MRSGKWILSEGLLTKARQNRAYHDWSDEGTIDHVNSRDRDSLANQSTLLRIHNVGEMAYQTACHYNETEVVCENKFLIRFLATHYNLLTAFEISRLRK